MSLDNHKFLFVLKTATIFLAVVFCVSFLCLASKGWRWLVVCEASLALTCLLFPLLIYCLRRRDNARLAEIMRNNADALKCARESAELNARTVESLAIAIDAKDQTTQGHVRRTRLYAAELGRLLRLDDEELRALDAGALLLNIGKLAVPDYILNKPGKLTAAEFEKMKVHASVGGDIVGRVNFPFPVEDVVRYHHERWDGTGYPRGLKGEQIPLVARIISVVDFYDATRCDRPYRAGMPREDSLALLLRKAGKAFDPVVVNAFVKNIEAFDRLIPEQDLGEQVQSAKSHAAQDVSGDDASRSEDRERKEEASAFRPIAEAQREVFALHEIAQTIGSTLNLKDTVALVAEKLRSIVPFDTCVIFVADDSTNKAEAVHAAGSAAEHFSRRRVTLGEGITGWVIANARSMRGTPPELDMAGVAAEAASWVRDAISSPLLRDDGAFGAITLYSSSESAYAVEHVRLLESVCLHASSAINNALTHERTKQSALTDHLTGLPNSRALHLMLEQRLAESQRRGREPLAVLSVDIDGLKQLNESFGHGVGDRVLASVALVIKGQLRQMDMLARYSGGEFVAVLPGASGDVAVMIAERVRTAVESHDFPVKTGRSAQVGVGLGLGCYHEDGETPDELILAATRDMRRNKQARKRTPASHASASVVSIDAYR